MRTVSLIEKKRDGGELTEQEIETLIQGYTNGNIPDYQMAAWAMAVYFRGMTEQETAALTLAMARSGETVDLSGIPGIKVDKHSTGGVGDKTTLVLAPLVAACGVPVAKMSGRGLGHTGGTIDKLESIPGFTTDLSRQQFLAQVNEIGVAVAGQTANIAPADKKLYALRDVTATVASIPLIASSVMSKKIAAGADAIVLDVKTGSGAFMKTLEDAVQLAEAMVKIGKEIGRETIAVISNMDQPLGYAIGNALEVKEAIEALRGDGPSDLKKLCLELGTHMLRASGIVNSEEEARARLEEIWASGRALEKFKAWITAQGGDASVVDAPEQLLGADTIVTVHAQSSGFVAAIDAERIGVAAMMLGAGRETIEDQIDPAVGIVLSKKVGDFVEKGETLAELHVNGRKRDPGAIMQMVEKAYTWSEQAPENVPLVRAICDRQGTRYF